MNGSVYSPERRAAACPACGAWVKARNVYPWDNGVRIRRHKCSCGYSFKSDEKDPTYRKVQAA